MITGLTVHENLFGQSSTCTAFPPLSPQHSFVTIDPCILPLSCSLVVFPFIHQRHSTVLHSFQSIANMLSIFFYQFDT